MYYFDFVMADLSQYSRLTSKLGFRKIFSPNEVSVVKSIRAAQPSGRSILISSDNRELSKSPRAGSIVGVIFEDMAVRKMLMSELRDSGKFLVFAAWQIVSEDSTEAVARIRKARELARNALHIGVPLAIASLAPSIDDVYSSMQLIEMAMLIGAGEETSRRMLNAMGELLYDTKKKK